MSDEPSNAASRYLREGFAILNGLEFPSGKLLRTTVTDDFVYADRRRGPSFPNVGAEDYPKFVQTIWETGVGQPRLAVPKILAVRGERFAAMTVHVDYGNGMTFESITVLALDATLSLSHRSFDFDLEDVDGAIAELDRLHNEADKA